MLAKLTRRTLAALPSSTKRLDVRDPDLHGFLLRLYPTGKRTWWYQFRAADGQHTRIKLGDSPGLSPEAARQMAADQMHAVRKGANPAKERKIAKQTHNIERASTLRAFLDDHFEPWAKTHIKSFKAQLERLRSDFEKWLDKPLASIDQPSLEALRRTWRATLTPRTVNRDMQRLQGVLSRAVEWGALPVSPFKGLKPLKYDKRKAPKFLNPDELAALHKALTGREDRMRAERSRMNKHLAARGKKPMSEHDGEFVDYLRPMALVSLNGGLRRGELFNLAWPAINFAIGILEVEGDESDEGGTGSKSGHSRIIPMNHDLKATLSAWHRQRGCPADGLVFPSPDTGERFTNINKSWRAVKKEAGLPRLQFRWLRDTFASRLVQAGVPLNTVRELMGHADIATTLIYAHLAPQNLRAAVELLGTA